MTSRGDSIVRDALDQELPTGRGIAEPGADPGRDDVAWQTPGSGGMTNPMTSAGDIIHRRLVGTPGRLAVGATAGMGDRVVSGAPDGRCHLARVRLGQFKSPGLSGDDRGDREYRPSPVAGIYEARPSSWASSSRPRRRRRYQGEQLDTRPRTCHRPSVGWSIGTARPERQCQGSPRHVVACRLITSTRPTRTPFGPGLPPAQAGGAGVGGTGAATPGFIRITGGIAMAFPDRPCRLAAIETDWGQAVHDYTFAPAGCKAHAPTATSCGTTSVPLQLDTVDDDPGGSSTPPTTGSRSRPGRGFTRLRPRQQRQRLGRDGLRHALPAGRQRLHRIDRHRGQRGRDQRRRPDHLGRRPQRRRPDHVTGQRKGGRTTRASASRPS